MSDNVSLTQQKEPPDRKSQSCVTTPKSTPIKTRSWTTEVKETNANLSDATLEGREDVVRQLMQTPVKRPRPTPPQDTPNKVLKGEQVLSFQELDFNDDLTIVTDEDIDETSTTNETTEDNGTGQIEEFSSQETDVETQTHQTQTNEKRLTETNIAEPPDNQLTNIENEIQAAYETILQKDTTEGQDNSRGSTNDEDRDNEENKDDEEDRITLTVRLEEFLPPTPAEDNSEETNEEGRFVGKSTIITNIGNILKNFNKIQMIKDLKATYPDILSYVECIGRRDRSDLEIALKPQVPPTLYHHVLQQGLNTHNTHLQFIPDTSDTKVTKITLFGLPHELPNVQVDEAMRQFGNVVSSYRHKERIDDLVIHTGRRVYTMSLEKPIPKIITIAGHNVNTIYTGQKEDLEKQRVIKDKEEKKKKEEEQHWERERHKIRFIKDGAKMQLKSFLHPEVDSHNLSTQQRVIKRFREVLSKHHDNKDLYIEKYGKPPPAEYRRNGKKYSRQPVDVTAVLAMADTQILERIQPAHDATIDHLRAVLMYKQFGWCEEGIEYLCNKRCFTENQVEIWKHWSKRALIGDQDFIPGKVEDFLKFAVEDAVGGYYYSIPMG